ncbi:Subtilase family protein [uncultured archaeon]|nr:Subtilase family protein [uncultured archaeon]
MAKEDLNLRHFNFKPDVTPKTRRLRRGYGRQSEYSAKVAREYLDEFTKFVEVYTDELPTFWVINTKDESPIYSEESMNAITSFFGAELVKIVTDNCGIIKISTAKLASIKKKMEKNKKNKKIPSEYPGYVLKVLNGKLKQWGDEDKISKILLNPPKTLDENHTADLQKIDAYLATFFVKDKSEEQLLKTDLKKFFSDKGIEPIENEIVNTFTLHNVSRDTIVEISKKGFVDFIDPILPLAYSESKRQEPTTIDPIIMEIPEASLGYICVLDSGVTSSKMDKYLIKESFTDTKEDTEEKFGHGTLVSSIAMFGQNTLGKMNILKPKAKVISYNIWEKDNLKLPLHEIIRIAYEKESHRTRVFNLSVNYFYPPSNEYELKAQINQAYLIERFANQTDIVLVNSAGNHKKKDLFERVKGDFSKYLETLSVASPAYAPSVFSVGATDNQKRISEIGLVGVPFLKKKLNFSDRTNVNFRSPQIFAFGGNNSPNEEDVVYCLSKGDRICKDVGTSFSAPLVSLACQKVIELYKPEFCQNSETVKAIVVNSSSQRVFNGKKYFLLDDVDSVGTCTNSLFFNFEGRAQFPIKNEDLKKEEYNLLSGSFYVPKQVSGIDFVLGYSLNYYLKQLDLDYVEPHLRIYGITKNRESPRKIYDTNLYNPNGSIIFGKVDYEQNFHGKWYWDLYFESKNIPVNHRRLALIRYGLSIRVSLNNAEETILGAYKEATKELGIREIKDAKAEMMKEQIRSSLSSFR